jgi:hypothetical protein
LNIMAIRVLGGNRFQYKSFFRLPEGQPVKIPKKR